MQFKTKYGSRSDLGDSVLKATPVARCRPLVRTEALPKHQKEFDVVVIGAGIIGLMTAEAFLKRNLSVALLERKQPCSGATGAGQGYIWMAHRSPNTAAWDLASCSVSEWKKMTDSDPELRGCVEWQKTGSLLLSTSEEEAEKLQLRQEKLHQHNVQSRFLSVEEVQQLEPSISRTMHRGALLTEEDAQINGRQCAFTLLERCKRYASMLHLSLDDPVERVVVQPSTNAETGAETASTQYHARLATVVASGVWSGQLMASLTGDTVWGKLLQPRRGHLIEVAPPPGMPPIKHGMMEMSYTQHYAPGSSTTTSLPQQPHVHHDNNEAVDITFTATTSTSGSLLIGSSREFSGWSSDTSFDIVAAIMDRAAMFLPNLSGLKTPEGPAVRVGLRPFAVGGAPIIGSVPGIPGLFIAAGHEGSGLCLGPATVQILTACVFNDGTNADKIERFSVFQPKSRIKSA
ncbi:hypothetical protein CEUSTIGMA_g12125.t1 [Chlamydomonas eustigma]|uniref:FAD-dependent oxidoreductase domain-containing protein 1 n=1 Tax=Chlamydomonas eustigma TaxID=1157962 RepID=A0A250XNX3_9CHLO|nr:hypothetical protein CEUSTIGMA_g12125.t1 [Chlamydomonas eustigma]|eukprot:GAX84703.1 hypothetical protein CEUSTIGMA_g12125.t1 [Chlamydomonas eustigma]